MLNATIKSGCTQEGKLCFHSENLAMNRVSDALPIENQVVNLYPEFTYQKIIGFGGAMTESTAYS